MSITDKNLLKFQTVLYHMETNLKYYVGKWIDYPWTRGDSLNYLVSDNVLNSKHDYGLPLAKCVSTENDYLILETKNEIFHVRPWNKMKIVLEPQFTWGDFVQEIVRPEIHGQIDNIIWHEKDQEYKFFIKINGKIKSRRYNSNELRLKENYNKENE